MFSQGSRAGLRNDFWSRSVCSHRVVALAGQEECPGPVLLSHYVMGGATPADELELSLVHEFSSAGDRPVCRRCAAGLPRLAYDGSALLAGELHDELRVADAVDVGLPPGACVDPGSQYVGAIHGGALASPDLPR